MLLVLRSLLDLVLPATCVGCGAEATAWCADCGVTLQGPARRTSPDPCPPALPPTWAVTPYDGAVRAAVIAHKERGAHALARPLGGALALAVRAAAAATDDVRRGPVRQLVLVPAPSRAAAVRERGRDPTAEIAAQAAAALRRHGVDAVACTALRMSRAARDQAGLDGPERAANLAGAVRCRRRAARVLRGRPVLLVDDVVTTGATLAESASVLHAAGADVRAAAVVAATVRAAGRHRGGVSSEGDKD